LEITYIIKNFSFYLIRFLIEDFVRFWIKWKRYWYKKEKERLKKIEVLIIAWFDKKGSTTKIIEKWADIMREDTIKLWIKKEKIEVVKWISSISEIIKLLEKMKNLKTIVYHAHWDENKAWVINKKNVTKFSNYSNSRAELFLISCNTWKWENPIAQEIANNLWITVIAPNDYSMTLLPDNANIWTWAISSIWILVLRLAGKSTFDTFTPFVWRFLYFYPQKNA
jgi:hypothetical protein